MHNLLTDVANIDVSVFSRTLAFKLSFASSRILFFSKEDIILKLNINRGKGGLLWLKQRQVEEGEENPCLLYPGCQQGMTHQKLLFWNRPIPKITFKWKSSTAYVLKL